MSNGIGFRAYPYFMSRLLDAASRKGFIVESLGEVGTGDQIYVLSPIVMQPDRPNVLVTAGFHGDEPGGVYGISRFIEGCTPEFISRVNLTILPAVNPAGLKLCRRFDFTDADPNRGYCHHEHMPALGEVGQILMNHASTLSERARHGFMTLHEDSTLEEQFYLISNDYTNESRDMRRRLIETGEKHFLRLEDGMHHDHFITEGNGAWFCDSSFEDMLSHDGVSRLYVIEAPSQSTVEARSEMISEIVHAFIDEIASMPIAAGSVIF